MPQGQKRRSGQGSRRSPASFLSPPAFLALCLRVREGKKASDSSAKGRSCAGRAHRPVTHVELALAKCREAYNAAKSLTPALLGAKLSRHDIPTTPPGTPCPCCETGFGDGPPLAWALEKSGLHLHSHLVTTEGAPGQATLHPTSLVQSPFSRLLIGLWLSATATDQRIGPARAPPSTSLRPPQAFPAMQPTGMHAGSRAADVA